MALFTGFLSQIDLRDAGGPSLSLSLAQFPAASCPASVTNSLSCLIVAADKQVCTGTADSV